MTRGRRGGSKNNLIEFLDAASLAYYITFLVFAPLPSARPFDEKADVLRPGAGFTAHIMNVSLFARHGPIRMYVLYTYYTNLKKSF